MWSLAAREGDRSGFEGLDPGDLGAEKARGEPPERELVVAGALEGVGGGFRSGALEVVAHEHAVEVGDGAQAILSLGATLKVSPNDAMLAGLERLFGENVAELR